jgi:hypothetical protein
MISIYAPDPDAFNNVAHSQCICVASREVSGPAPGWRYCWREGMRGLQSTSSTMIPAATGGMFGVSASPDLSKPTHASFTSMFSSAAGIVLAYIVLNFPNASIRLESRQHGPRKIPSNPRAYNLSARIPASYARPRYSRSLSGSESKKSASLY